MELLWHKKKYWEIFWEFDNNGAAGTKANWTKINGNGGGEVRRNWESEEFNGRDNDDNFKKCNKWKLIILFNKGGNNFYFFLKSEKFDK